jgi:hypothetical protein
MSINKHMDETKLITAPEFQVILQLLSPDYMWSTARIYGEGDAIRGAPKAYDETRKMIRMLVKQARERERVPGERLPRDLEFALLMRSLGWPLLSQVPRLDSVTDEGWRRLAIALWPTGANIRGGAFLNVGSVSFQDVYVAAIIATSRMLKEYPETNRAVLDNRVWQRKDFNVMVHFEVRNDLRSMVLTPHDKDIDWVEKKLFKGLRAAAKFSKTEMAKYSTQLLIEWARAGFIGSMAGAMVSGCPGATYGWGALAPANGIPLVVCIGKVENGKCFLGVTPDHRAFDGKVSAIFYEYLKPTIEEVLK